MRTISSLETLVSVVSIPRPAKLWNRAGLASTSTLTLGRAESLDEKQLPQKNGTRTWRFLRNRFFSCYRRLFTLAFLANIAALVAVLCQKWSAASLLSPLSTAVAANIIATIVVRLEHFSNFLYWIVGLLPKTLPLVMRRALIKMTYSTGGLHSGFGVSALMWFIALSVYTTLEFVSPDSSVVTPAILAVNYLLLALLLCLVVSAYPAIRAKFHDYFEQAHRYAGWASLVLFWVETLLLAVRSHQLNGRRDLGQILLRTPPFWILIFATLCIAWAWGRLRRRKVRAEVLSDHATRLWFDYKMSDGARAIRVSTSPVKEWHAFAAVQEAGVPGFSIIVSHAGDWTRNAIRNPPTSLWVRGSPVCGFLNAMTLYDSIVLVATGSGIGPCLSTLTAGRVKCHVLWSTRDPIATYGKDIVDAVVKADPDAVIYNTKVMGKPDMVAETWRLYKRTGAQAVCVISNPSTTYKIVYGMEARGVSAYGPIFDS